MTTTSESTLAIRYGGDMRNLLMSNRTFILQLAHPSVGAGVVQHSNFRHDPWSRLREIAYSGNQMMFHGHDAAVAEGHRLREMHRPIKGVNAHGEQYHALNPKVYGWVHFVFYESNLACHQLFGKPVPQAHQETLFQNWRASGQYFGLREQDLPASQEAYWEKWHDMMRDQLESNEAIEFIINLQQHQPQPPPALTWLPKPVWNAFWTPLAKETDLITVGSLPEAFREKLNLSWNHHQQQRFDQIRARIQQLFNWMPQDWRLMPEARRYLAQIH